MAPSSESALLGKTEPRLFTPPARPLTRQTSRGFEVIEFAEQVLGLPLFPWQQWLVKHALELDETGGPRFRTVLVLVARQNGKTTLLSVLNLWRMFVNGDRLILGTAQDLDVAKEAWQATVDLAQSVPDLAAEIPARDGIRRANGEQHLKLDSGARYKIKAATGKAGRGLSADAVVLDELREQTSWATWAALSKTTNARPDAQRWAITNAGHAGSVVLNHLRDAAINSRDPSIGLFEWSAPDGCELDDRDGWAQANPSLGFTITERVLESDLRIDPPEIFRTEVLCQNVESLDGAIDPAAWAACRDRVGTLDGLRDRLHVVVDVAPDSAHVTVAAAAVGDDEVARVEVIAAYDSTEDARRQLPDLLDRVDPLVVGWFPSGPAAALADVLAPYDDLLVSYGDTKAREVCQLFADLVAGRRVRHFGQPLLDSHVAASRRKTSGDGWRFARIGVGHVDAAYAAAGAVHSAATSDDAIRYDVLESVI